MAIPPLAHQIAVATGVALCTTEMSGGSISYRVAGVWKDTERSLLIGDSLRLDIRIHELLGYRPMAGRDVVLFLVAEGLPVDCPLEILPVVDGAVTYGPSDPSVRERLTAAELEELVRRG